MTGRRQVSIGGFVALRPGQGHGRVDDDAAVPVRAERSSSATEAVDLSNVVPFMRPRAPEARHAPPVALPTDAARLPATGLAGERTRLAAFAAVSLAVHGALFMAFWREPEPLASIGVEVISAEIVLGATAPAGVAVTPGEQQLQAAASATDPAETDPQRAAEQKATEQPQNVPVGRAETAPEQTTMLERQADERLPDDNKAAPREERQAEPKRAIAMVESPDPDTATAAPREIPPDTTELSLLPQPEEKPVEPKPEPKPQAAAPTPVKNAKPARERRRVAAPTRERAAEQARASTPSTAANSVGIGRSNNATNYAGLVSAHLRRHQQYPAGARSRGDQGTASVTFTLDAGGRVTAARLARSSGVSSIDSEVTAMVRRASPFPAPPAGRSVSFTVPVNFRLN
jgi:periplasmic protein TonB